jgi:pyridoxal phosphate enzyme (YggS family)
MISKSEFEVNLKRVLERMAAGCGRCGRDIGEVELMAVTKTHPVEAAAYAVGAGLEAVGENRVQELATKRPQLDLPLRWELIGPLQSNKARLAVEVADRIQTLDREKIIRVLDRQCGEVGRGRLPVLLQVNTAADPAKHGSEEADAGRLADLILASDHLELEGLMTIGELTNEEGRVRRTFVRLRELRERLRAQTGLPLPVLSMGMTGDLEWAIEEGSTLVRVGSALFGER